MPMAEQYAPRAQLTYLHQTPEVIEHERYFMNCSLPMKRSYSVILYAAEMHMIAFELPQDPE